MPVAPAHHVALAVIASVQGLLGKISIEASRQSLHASLCAFPPSLHHQQLASALAASVPHTRPKLTARAYNALMRGEQVKILTHVLTHKLQPACTCHDDKSNNDKVSSEYSYAFGPYLQQLQWP